MDDILLEPLKAYKEIYERQFDENAINYFEGLVKKSGIDREGNRKTVAEHKKETATAAAIDKKLSSHKALRGFLIFLAVAGFILLGVGIYLLATGDRLAGPILLCVGAALAVSTIVVCVKVLSPKIKRHEADLQLHRDKANALLKEAWSQMLALNTLFESNATKTLIETTVPLIKIDDNFDMRRYDYLSGKYGFGDNGDNASSTIAVLTGEILGNPFVVDRELVCKMGTATYTGSIIIHWTTTYRDSNGNTRTQSHSQTLTASVTKPKPYYSNQTRLIYGNEAAPDLTFSHEPTHAEDMSDKKLESTVKSGAKRIRKMQSKQMKSGGSTFTEMGNSEFDVLFNATDRNNEVQFRLLFTPLAQKNMLALMKDDYAYGDDFYFTKNGCLNFISSEHSQNWDLDTYYTRYQSYDIDDSLDKFLSFNRNYFKSLYFELAPLLCIPLYQQHKPKEYIYMNSYPRNYTSYEAEYTVNKLGQDYFKSPYSATNSILKTSFINKDGKSDNVRVTAYSYKAEDRVDFVSVFGGDGRMHAVPVHWTEYIPISQDSDVKMKQLDMTDKQFNDKLNDSDFKAALDRHSAARVFAHSILCCLAKPVDLSFDSEIDKVLQ